MPAASPEQTDAQPASSSKGPHEAPSGQGDGDGSTEPTSPTVEKEGTPTESCKTDKTDQQDKDTLKPAVVHLIEVKDEPKEDDCDSDHDDKKHHGSPRSPRSPSEKAEEEKSEDEKKPEDKRSNKRSRSRRRSSPRSARKRSKTHDKKMEGN